MPIVLASASPRRVELLRAAGFLCDVRPVTVDESRLAGEHPTLYVSRVAALKADTARALWPEAVILAADTAVVLDDAVFGKPVDRADAARMLRALGGRSHEVLTGVAIRTPAGSADFVECTRVWFTALTDDDIAWYVGTGEPMDKAGAYAIQGLASRFIPRIDGSYANVVGLPVARLAEALQELAPEAGRPILEQRAASS